MAEQTNVLGAECDLCENEGPMFLHARCHMTAPLQASIEGDILTLRCYIPTCARVVSRMKVTAIVPLSDPADPADPESHSGR